MQEDFVLIPSTTNTTIVPDNTDQQETGEEEIDERIDIHDLLLGNQQQQDEQQPLQSPDLLKYYYITQILRARNSPGNIKGFFEDWMFKEQVAALASAAHQ